MKLAPHFPQTPAGAVLTSCNLDATCTPLDCDAVMDEFGELLMQNPAGQDFLAHYCGYQYVSKLQGPAESEE